MSKIRKIVMSLGTISCAFGIGFFVQKGETAPIAPVQVIQTAVVKPVMGPLPDRDAMLEIQGITLTSALPDSKMPQRLVEPQPDLSSAACAVTATATPAPMANVDLVVQAPCYRNDRATIHHNGMMFTVATDKAGSLKMTVPALTTNAVFIVGFAANKGAVAITRVPNLADYHRVVLQWVGESAFQIHAREFGAGYGTSGHIWHGMNENKSPDRHGSIVRLGDADTLAPHLAEIYTFPHRASTQSGTVSMSIEAEVTASNCGKEVSAQTIELGGAGRLKTRNLVLTVPDCTTIGDFLVLNNLVNDMKIAAN
jgi:hypothetical protein